METTLIVGIINIILFYFIWYIGYKNYFIDLRRHELFQLRNRLFNYALENNIAFDHPAFVDRWKEINGAIKYSHEIHLIFFTALMDIFIYNNKTETEYLKRREDNLKLLDKKDQRFFEKILEEEKLLFGQYLVKSSLILIALYTIIGLINNFSKIYNFISKKQKTRLKNKLKKTQNYVFDNFSSHLATT